MITISKQSKTYKFYDFLSKIFLFKNVTPFHRGGIDTFRDICTFARVTLLYILFSLPLFLAFFSTIFFTLYSLFISLFTLTMNPVTSIVVVITVVLLGLSGIAGIVILILFIIEKTSDKFENNTFINLVTESISSKHNKFCQILKVVDESTNKTAQDKKD